MLPTSNIDKKINALLPGLSLKQKKTLVILIRAFVETNAAKLSKNKNESGYTT
jgi:hypothetical protein